MPDPYPPSYEMVEKPPPVYMPTAYTDIESHAPVRRPESPRKRGFSRFSRLVLLLVLVVLIGMICGSIGALLAWNSERQTTPSAELEHPDSTLVMRGTLFESE